MPRTIVDLTASSPPCDLSTGSRLLADPVLRNAIDTAPIDRLRLTLRAICSQSTTASDTARSLLLTSRGRFNEEETAISESIADEEEEEEDEDEEEEDEDDEREAATARKRKIPRFAVCRICLEDFDANAKRRKYECVWHPVSKEPDWDSDVWCDWDEDCHGNIEDQGDEFPQGFTWSCCGERGDFDGCRVGKHEEYVGDGRPYKRVRY